MPKAKALPDDEALRIRMAALGPLHRARFIARLDPPELDAVEQDWGVWGHKGQHAPPNDWRTWVIMAGRGFGKTRAGAEWVRMVARDIPGARIALVAASLDEARRVMIEGSSGLLAVAGNAIDNFYPSLRLLRFANGAEATLFSGASPEQLRGPEHHAAWCDELAKWRQPGATWDMLQMGLRLGDRPRALVTTTPRPGRTLERIMAANGTVLTGGPTRANPHLPDAFIAAMHDQYAGTRLGRQELDGELLPDVEGALWTMELIERCRFSNPPLATRGEGDHAKHRGGAEGEARSQTLRFAPGPSTGCAGPPPLQKQERIEFVRTVIGVDPPASAGTCGIVACARDAAGIAHVLADHSVTGRRPEAWARAVAAAAEVHRADRIVAERNQGGEMVRAVLRAADARLPVRLVHAAQGKSARAEPVHALFEAGKVVLHGRFPELEAELCGLIAGGGYEAPAWAGPGGPGASPDRADAMVWALTELMLGEKVGEPRLRRF
ncbi:ATP-binding protein [Sphingomonas sp. MAH-20]|uniref:ATP-binding protein n=1 Tax=Sphingomonas horti TaxID=2682842 RepID=A0A6I4IWH0_9SPHN|nr:terminase family protein [Sphingomonas sp. CGMCC 1.13658]MVO76363.1 ATP-binding protein [Sphingomonas horti]